MGNDRDVSDMSYSGDSDFEEVLFDYVIDELGMEVDADTDTNAVKYVNQYTRNPVPQGFVWDLSTRAPKRSYKGFYWLKADDSANKGVIDAYYDEETNTVVLGTEGEVNAEISILANPFLFDFSRELTVITPNDQFSVELEADQDTIADSVAETGDLFLSWADEVKVSLQ